MNSIISAKNIYIRFGKTEVLRDVSFEIEKGDFVGLVGPNGAGKTSLVKAIFGLVPLSSGKIILFGEAHNKFSKFSKIGYLPQKHSSINHLFPASVGEVVLLGLLAGKKTPKIITTNDRESILEIMKKLQISHLKNKMISELSGGQQQRVLLARALVSRPELLIFDEPSTALDPESRRQFFEIIQEENKKNGTTIILITHDTGYVGACANKLLYIDQKLVFFGKIEDFCPSGEVNSCFERTDSHVIWHQHR